MNEIITDEKQYIDLLNKILLEGDSKGDRTGTGTYSIFGTQMRFNLNDGATFPLFTTKSVHWKSIVHELLWFISGDTNIKYLQDNGVRIWNEWADENGDLGPVYGEQWRNFGGEEGGNAQAGKRGVDQLQNCIYTLRTNPNDRRIIVSAWNPSVLPDNDKSFSENVDDGKCALPPCHAFFQFYVNGDKLSLQMYQRSVDSFLGLPFNVASYSLLLLIVARLTGLRAHEFVWVGGDTHIYLNHLNQVKEQMERSMRSFPQVLINKDLKEIDDIVIEDIDLINYCPHPSIKGKVAV